MCRALKHSLPPQKMAAPKTKIFVGHLPDNCRSEDLQALFEKHGVVKECDVINKYGFVHMSTAEEADAAIKALNNFEFMGSRLSVEQSKSKLHPEPGASGRAKGNAGRRGGMAARNGFGPVRGGGGGMNGSFAGGYTNGYRRFDSAPYADSFYGDGSYFARDRLRPYPSPFERRPLDVPPVREDYSRQLPPPPGPRDPYARPLAGPPMGPQRTDLYERRPVTERADYLYSRRSPPSSLPMSSFWYEDSFGERDGRSPAFPARRPAYY